MVLVISEHRGAFSPVKIYKIGGEEKSSGDGVVVSLQQQESGGQPLTNTGRFTQKCLITFRQIFLPHGFPQSVSSDYMAYQLWDTVQAFASSITGALATEAVMKGVGVGDKLATPLAAAMTWLLKSGSGMIGQIVFAWANGTALDYDNKKWRLFADVLNDIATFVDLITPLFPSHLTIVVFCASSIARALVGVAGGATRSSITQHQAKANNSADVSAKDGSQETLVNLISLVACLILLPMVSGNHSIVWTLFALSTWIHVFSNYRALKSLQLESFNTSRLLLCIKQYLSNGTVPSIKEVNGAESIVIGFGITDMDTCQFRIRLGVPLEDLTLHEKLTEKYLENLITSSQGKPFLMALNSDKMEVNVVLHENLQPNEIIEAYVRAIFLAHYFKTEKITMDALDPRITEDWEIFRNSILAKGFDLNQALLKSEDWRAKWKHS